MKRKLISICICLVIMSSIIIPSYATISDKSKEVTKQDKYDLFVYTIRTISNALGAVYQIFEHEDGEQYDVLLYNENFPPKLAWIGGNWAATVESLCDVHESLSIIVGKTIVIYLSNNLEFSSNNDDRGYIKISNTGKIVTFTHVIDGYIISKKIYDDFLYKMNYISDVLSEVGDSCSLTYDEENNTVNLVYEDDLVFGSILPDMLKALIRKYRSVIETLDVDVNFIAIIGDGTFSISVNGPNIIVSEQLSNGSQNPIIEELLLVNK